MNILSDLQEVIRLMTSVDGLSTLSVVLHVLGYIMFNFVTQRMKYKPNPTAWLMFAYGTTFIALLEWDLQAPWTVLALPVVCSILSIRIAWSCWKKGTLKWPSHTLDRIALATDLILTVAYLATGMVARSDLISSETRTVLISVFLVITTIGSILPFVPQIRGVYEDSSTEHWSPWLFWVLAYGLLAATTVLEEGGLTLLLLYPVLNFILHSIVLWFVLVSRPART